MLNISILWKNNQNNNFSLLDYMEDHNLWWIFPCTGLKLQRLKGDIEFVNVSFNYSSRKKVTSDFCIFIATSEIKIKFIFYNKTFLCFHKWSTNIYGVKCSTLNGYADWVSWWWNPSWRWKIWFSPIDFFCFCIPNLPT